MKPENNILNDNTLVITYQETKDPFYLNKIIEKYTPLIKATLSLYKIPAQDYEDSYQELILIFIKLVNQYKPGQVNFNGYVKTKLKKRYFHYIRKNYR